MSEATRCRSKTIDCGRTAEDTVSGNALHGFAERPTNAVVAPLQGAEAIRVRVPRVRRCATTLGYDVQRLQRRNITAATVIGFYSKP